jgi:gliding motility-associated-like protein
MRKILFFLSFFFLSLAVLGTHQRAGEITYTAISDLKYEFKIVTYTYTPSPADRPELPINWGDGSSSIVQRTKKIDLPNNISRNEYDGIVHTFPGQGSYTISLEDPNRNYGVLNIPNSVNVPFFLQTELAINPFLGPNNSVQLLAAPIDKGCVSSIYMHNPAAYDIDGDSLSYKLTICRGEGGLPIPGYIFPNQVNTQIPTTFEIDPFSGTIIWDKPLMQGEYNIAFLIEEWRYGVRIGYVTRDMQIAITACSNQPPIISPLQDDCVVVGETLSFTVSATDPDNDWLSLHALGGPLILPENPASFPSASGKGSVQSTFTWTPACSHVQLQPYQIVFTAKDSLNFPQLVDIKTVNIEVISTGPENLSASSVGNSIHLSWQKALCTQALKYEIYRRNGLYGYQPQHCETGVPNYTGYQKIGETLNISDTTFIDTNNGTGLIHGIDYCYMVVTLFSDGGKSIASQEACASLKRDIPIITNVSVEVTSQSAGEIFVAWSKPTELDTILYPAPYHYIIQRATTDSPNSFSVCDSTLSINDTIFIDKELNTTKNSYLYKVDLYSEPFTNRVFIGSTHTAQSIFLKIEPSDRTLTLNWDVNVPWDNDFYLIFRQNPETLEYDSIGFSANNNYRDSDLINGENYTYFVRSTGYYSIQSIVSPIINFSQIVSETPIDIDPPCAQLLETTTNCDAVENILTWYNPSGCPTDIAKYLIFYSPQREGELVLLDSIDDPFTTNYTHKNLFSIAGCYGVIAVDSAGNQSQMSNIQCVDISECGTYRLPNVFTPNDDTYNDRFKAFEFTSVERINLIIFNRWGRIVYQTTDPWFQWDGKNQQNNRNCSEGVYFYVCDVFEIQLEGLTKRTIKGSITLLR